MNGNQDNQQRCGDHYVHHALDPERRSMFGRRAEGDERNVLQELHGKVGDFCREEIRCHARANALLFAHFENFVQSIQVQPVPDKYDLVDDIVFDDLRQILFASQNIPLRLDSAGAASHPHIPGS